MSFLRSVTNAVFAKAWCAAAVFLLAAAASGTDRTFGDGRLSVSVSDATGFPVAYAVDGRTVVTATDPRQPFRIAENWYAVTNDGSWMVESIAFATNVLTTVTRAGHWRVGHVLTLFPEALRIRRTFSLAWTADVPVKFRGFDIDAGTFALGPSGSYRLPCVLPVAEVAARDLKPGRRRETYESPYAVLAADGAGRSVAWALDDARPYCDNGFTSVREGSDAISVTVPFACAGHARAGGCETVGDLWMCFGSDATTESALRAMPAWFAAVGQFVPPDRPEWISRAVVYSMHPGGTFQSRWTDWGGFASAAAHLGRIAALGADTVWLLPCEDGSPYYPRDYFGFMDGLGTEDDYRAFLRQARAAGLRTLRDIVPHGGTDATPRAKAHPDWLLRDEDGKVGGFPEETEPDAAYWVFDMGHPAWQAYMSDVARRYVADGLDGLRGDACGGSPSPNWDPALVGRRASLSGRPAGLAIQRAIRAGIKRANPDGILLAEGDLGVFGTASDVLYDWSLAFRGLRAFVLGDVPSVVDGLRRYLNDEQYGQVPGHLRLRYQSNHDSLHAELVYGCAQHLANAALLAWMPGVAFVYQEEEYGHTFALREIFRMRRELPELTLGTPEYLSERAAPGVYAARFTKGDAASVVRINFNATPADGLAPFEYSIARNGRTVFSSHAHATAKIELPEVGAPAIPAETAEKSDGGRRFTWRFPAAKRWCVLTADGRYEEAFACRHPFYERDQKPMAYHRTMFGPCQFDTRLHPFGFTPECAAVAVERMDGTVWLATFAATDVVRLLEDPSRPDELTVVATGTGTAPAFAAGVWPAQVAVTTGDGRLRPTMGGWRFEEGDLRVELVRGGAIRGVWRRDAVGAWRQVCGTATPRSTAGFGPKVYDALWECEAHVRLARDGGKLRLRFEGELRDRTRFGQSLSPIRYVLAYTFGGDGEFTVTPSVETVDFPGCGGGLLAYEVARGEASASAPEIELCAPFGNAAKVAGDPALLYRAAWMDRTVRAFRRRVPSGFTLRFRWPK